MMTKPLPEVGQIFQGRYEIIRLLGQGGFARVYQARQTDLDRPVALKLMLPGRFGDEPSDDAVARH